jgi:hypothetical protein
MQGRLLTLLLTLLLSLPCLAAWRTTQFEVFVGEPELESNTAASDISHVTNITVGSTLAQQYFDTPPTEVIEEIERYLHELAVLFEREGFADPVAARTIQPLVMGEDGIERIRVYLLDMQLAYHSDKLGALANTCDNPEWRPSLLLNTRYTFGGNRVTDRGYQTIAHELFHAIQRASAFQRIPTVCRQGKWITEGIPDAIGFDYARRLRPINFGAWSGSSINKPWGMRDYSEPLNKHYTGGDTSSYQTMSFWRHLAEWHYQRKQQHGAIHPGSVRLQEVRTDYTYLVDLFATRPAGAGADNELKWLDDWMKSSSTMAAGLAPIYAQFISTYAGFADNRFRDLPARVRNKWPMKAFGGECEEVALSEQQPKSAVSLQIDPAAARCLVVRVGGGGGPQQIVIDNGNLNMQGQEQLYIGTAGGQLLSPALVNIAEPPSADAGRSFAKWEFLVEPGAVNYFVVVNINDRPASTMNVRPELHFSLPGWKSSMTQENEGAGSGSGQPGKQPTTRKAVENYKKALRHKPTNRSAAAAISGSDQGAEKPGCNGLDRSRNICGKQLVVSLSKDFGLTPGQGPVSDTGGLLNQMRAPEITLADEAAFSNQLATMAEGSPGHTIGIAIPYIGYGETGSFGNAVIEVANKLVNREGGRAMDTFVAVSRMPDDDGVYPPNGEVAITEYTPHILRGTFRAELVSREDWRKAEVTRDNPQLPLSSSISGEFTVSAPWRGNGAHPDARSDGAMMKGIRNDMIDILQKVPPELRSSLAGSRLGELCQMGFEDSQLQGLGIGGSCGNGSGGAMAMLSRRCECDCEGWQQAQTQPGCARECDAKWQSWSCGPYLETGLGELDAETRRYQGELQQLGLPEVQVTSMTHTFKVSPPEIRQGIWRDLEQYQGSGREEALAAEMDEIRAEQSQRKQNYDDETLRYQRALQEAGYTEAEVAGLTEIFAPAPESTRKVFWQTVGQRGTPEN